MAVFPDIESKIKDFIDNKKVIAACCMSPILLARILGTKFGGPGATITLGSKGELWPYSCALNIANDWGNNVVHGNIEDVVFDEKKQDIHYTSLHVW